MVHWNAEDGKGSEYVRRSLPGPNEIAKLVSVSYLVSFLINASTCRSAGSE